MRLTPSVEASLRLAFFQKLSRAFLVSRPVPRHIIGRVTQGFRAYGAADAAGLCESLTSSDRGTMPLMPRPSGEAVTRAHMRFV